MNGIKMECISIRELFPEQIVIGKQYTVDKMKIKYSTQKGYRYKKGTYKYKGKRRYIYDGLEAIDCNGNLLWWNGTNNKWILYKDWDNTGNISSHNGNIHSLKSAIRHIRKHNEAVTGTIFVLRAVLRKWDIQIVK